MFDIGWTELLIIGIVALIVVGPKDLPGMFRTLGRFTGKARAMARDFQRAMEQAADDSGVKDMARDFREAASSHDFGTDDLRDLGRDPKKWARDAARKSVLSPEEAAEAEGEVAPEQPARPRGPATEALAKARSDAAAARRAEVDARRAATAQPERKPDTPPDTPASGPSPDDEGGQRPTQPADRT